MFIIVKNPKKIIMRKENFKRDKQVFYNKPCNCNFVRLICLHVTTFTFKCTMVVPGESGGAPLGSSLDLLPSFSYVKF